MTGEPIFCKDTLQSLLGNVYKKPNKLDPDLAKSVNEGLN